MDDIIVRSRYPRHNVPNRRRRKYQKDDNSLIEKITRQLIVSIILLVVIIIVKSINTPATNYLTDKIKSVSAKNIELKNLYKRIDDLLGKPVEDKQNSLEENAFDESSIPDSAEMYEPEETRVAGVYSEGYADWDNEVQVLDNSHSLVNEIKEKHSFITPVDGVVSSPFGERLDPKTNTLKFHKGIDIEVNNGSLIKAALDGVVIEAAAEPAYGNYLKIEHGNNMVTVYAHCSKLAVKKGQEVKQGDIIAKVGDTGASVGSHLHFEIWKDGKVIDPLSFVSIPLE